MNPPAGFALLQGEVPAEVTEIAKKLLAGDMGSVSEFSIGGRHFLSRIEPHAPAPSRGLPTWHKGVTIYERIAGTASTALASAAKLGVFALACWCVYRMTTTA